MYHIHKVKTNTIHNNKILHLITLQWRIVLIELFFLKHIEQTNEILTCLVTKSRTWLSRVFRLSKQMRGSSVVIRSRNASVSTNENEILLVIRDVTSFSSNSFIKLEEASYFWTSWTFIVIPSSLSMLTRFTGPSSLWVSW